MMQRGFSKSEFQARTRRAQAMMEKHNIAALLLTTEPDVRYFTGFLTQFWQSPTRPWFLIVPASGKPVAVIPSIGQELMNATWIDDIRTWASPNLVDDGISLVSDTLNELVNGGVVAIPDGSETHVRLPYADIQRLSETVTLTSDKEIVRTLRMVKSDPEIEKIRHACGIADQAFDSVKTFAGVGKTQSEINRTFQMSCLSYGADSVPYVAMGLGACGYFDVISPASDVKAQSGDILMLDTGLMWDGYFCDFDRNFALGEPDLRAISAHAKLLDATAAGFEAAVAGATAADIFHAMAKITGAGKALEAGRFGHGLGTQLTEWPSLIPDDHTELREGMVLTLEPSIETIDGRILVHEENIVIRANGAEKLSRFATEMAVIK
jgi:Xaa-Pro aminopeptidase